MRLIARSIAPGPACCRVDHCPVRNTPIAQRSLRFLPYPDHYPASGLQQAHLVSRLGVFLPIVAPGVEDFKAALYHRESARLEGGIQGAAGEPGAIPMRAHFLGALAAAFVDKAIVRGHRFCFLSFPGTTGERGGAA